VGYSGLRGTKLPPNGLLFRGEGAERAKRAMAEKMSEKNSECAHFRWRNKDRGVGRSGGSGKNGGVRDVAV